ncbi:MAG: sigma-70 family RNA polymerase sigma factor [Flavobacteriaceae bacterium]
MLTVSEKKNVVELDPNKWVPRYADFLFNYGITRISDAIVVEDLVQETFLAGIKAAPNFKGEASEKTWLTSIFKRKIVDHYRKINSKKAKFEVGMNYLGEEMRNSVENFGEEADFDQLDQDLERGVLSNVLASCMMNLKGNQRKVFQLKTVDGLETEEICKELGISSSNLWVLLHRARVQLKECVTENWYNKDL